MGVESSGARVRMDQGDVGLKRGDGCRFEQLKAVKKMTFVSDQAWEARMHLAMARAMRMVRPDEARRMAIDAVRTAATAAHVACSKGRDEDQAHPWPIWAEPILRSAWLESFDLSQRIRHMEGQRSSLKQDVLPEAEAIWITLLNERTLEIAGHTLSFDAHLGSIVGTNPHGASVALGYPDLENVIEIRHELQSGHVFGQVPDGMDEDLEYLYAKQEAILLGRPAVLFDAAFQSVFFL